MMKKSLVAAAVLSVLGAGASAQSSVTLYGVADVGLTYGKGSVASRTQLSQGNLTASRIGFRGVEDLGGGLRANFTLESGVNVDDGSGQATNVNNQPAAAIAQPALTFNRLSFVGLSGGWGQVRFGRDWTPNYTQVLRYDVANGGGLGISQSALSAVTYSQPTGLRASNAFEYFTPNLGGFTGHFMHALGENASNVANKSDGRYTALRVTYAAGPLDIGLAHGVHKIAAQGDIKDTSLGATWDVAGVRLNGLITVNNSGLANDMRGWQLGVTKAFGATELRGSVSNARIENAAGARVGNARKLNLMAIHSLSKRTQVYAIAARTSNSSGSAALPNSGIAVNGPNGSATGLSLGVRHVF